MSYNKGMGNRGFNKGMDNKGFSLIELLVVVAIVAVLSAIATPVYQGYSVRAKVATVVPLMDSLIEQAKTYYARTGSFPDALQLGYSTNSGAPYIVDSSVLPTWNPYVGAAFIGNYYSGAQGEVSLALNITNFTGYNSSFSGGLISGYGNVLTMDTFINANTNGTFTIICTYRTDLGLTADIAAEYLPSSCQTAQSGVPGPAPN